MALTKMHTKMRYSAPIGEIKESPGGYICSAQSSKHERRQKANELLRIIGRMREP